MVVEGSVVSKKYMCIYLFNTYACKCFSYITLFMQSVVIPA